MQNQPSIKQITTLGLILSLSGWIGIVILILYTLPTLGSRWLFFFLFMLALCGTAIPTIALLHKRFPSSQSVQVYVIIRQAIWFGIYGDLLVWMQLGRVFDINRAFFLAFSFVAIEILLRMLERSRWQPTDSDDEPVK